MSVDWTDWHPFEGGLGRPLAEVDRRTAEEYFEGLIAARQERRRQLEALLERNGVEIGFDEAGLQRLDDWYQANVRGVDEDHLTDRWHAVGLDIGLYLGDAIIEREPGVEWRLFTHDKREMTYQRPVLMGFDVKNKKYNVDPEILVGTHGLRILAGDEEPRDFFVQVVTAGTP